MFNHSNIFRVSAACESSLILIMHLICLYRVTIPTTTPPSPQQHKGHQPPPGIYSIDKLKLITRASGLRFISLHNLTLVCFTDLETQTLAELIRYRARSTFRDDDVVQNRNYYSSRAIAVSVNLLLIEAQRIYSARNIPKVDEI